VRGSTFYVTTYKGVTVAVGAVATDNNLRAAIQFSNNTGSEKSLNPEKAYMAIYESEAVFLAGGTPILLPSFIPYEAKQREKNRKPTDRNADLGVQNGVRPPFQASAKRSGTAGEVLVTPKSNTTTYSGPLVPDMPRRTIFIVDSVYDHPLAAQKVPDGTKVAGYIFFKPKGKKLFRVLSILVEETEFLFPIDYPIADDPSSGK
jgi:hypothetical protein